MTKLKQHAGWLFLPPTGPSRGPVDHRSRGERPGLLVRDARDHRCRIFLADGTMTVKYHHNGPPSPSPIGGEALGNRLPYTSLRGFSYHVPRKASLSLYGSGSERRSDTRFSSQLATLFGGGSSKVHPNFPPLLSFLLPFLPPSLCFINQPV